MVRTFGIRDKYRSKALQEFRQSRVTKRARTIEKDESSDDDEAEKINPSLKNILDSESLLSILPKPKNSNVFGPTVKLTDLFKAPEKESDTTTNELNQESETQRLAEDGMVEIDVSKIVGDVSQTVLKNLTVEKAKPVVIPKGREKQKNQITYLAQLGKANELERKEQAAQSRINKAAARSKYGW